MPEVDFSDLQPVEPPDRSGVRPELAEAVRRASEFLFAGHAVSDGKGYEQRGSARWRATRLRALLVKLELVKPFELRERVWREQDGWHWAVRKPGGQDGEQQ